MTLEDLKNKVIEVAFKDLSTNKNHTVQIDNALKVITTLTDLESQKELTKQYSKFGEVM